MNKLEKRVKMMESFPTWLRSFLIGITIPYTKSSRVRFEKVTSSEMIVSVKNTRTTRNHIGQVHACAMILIAESATGILVGLNCPDTSMPLIKSLNTSFVRRSKGWIRATATLTDNQKDYIRNTPKGEILVPVKVVDSTGEQPIIVEALWAWTQKK
jgi:acyl-coenzyme A thioesterase PaaI-like protein